MNLKYKCNCGNDDYSGSFSDSESNDIIKCNKCGEEYKKSMILKVIRYNLANFGCTDPLDCKTIDEFLGYYYSNLEDDAEKECD